MTATLTVTETDVEVALRRVDKALERLEPMTGALVHLLRNDLTVARLALLSHQRTTERDVA